MEYHALAAVDKELRQSDLFCDILSSEKKEVRPGIETKNCYFTTTVCAAQLATLWRSDTMKDLWMSFKTPLQRRFRKSRAELIKRMVPNIEGASIIDVGGSLPFWREVGSILKPGSVRIFNISQHRATMFMDQSAGPDWLSLELYDGKRLPVADNAADIAICNSVIEHVPPAARENLAAELQRVARTYIVQTPSPLFPVELHFGLPFVHWLPRTMGRQIVPISPFAVFSKVDAKQYFDDTQLLTKRELTEYFPGCEVVTEALAGLPKSNIAFGHTTNTDTAL